MGITLSSCEQWGVSTSPWVGIANGICEEATWFETHGFVKSTRTGIWLRDIGLESRIWPGSTTRGGRAKSVDTNFMFETTSPLV